MRAGRPAGARPCSWGALEDISGGEAQPLAPNGDHPSSSEVYVATAESEQLPAPEPAEAGDEHRRRPAWVPGPSDLVCDGLGHCRVVRSGVPTSATSPSRTSPPPTLPWRKQATTSPGAGGRSRRTSPGREPLPGGGEPGRRAGSPQARPKAATTDRRRHYAAGRGCDLLLAAGDRSATGALRAQGAQPERAATVGAVAAPSLSAPANSRHAAGARRTRTRSPRAQRRSSWMPTSCRPGPSSRAWS